MRDENFCYEVEIDGKTFYFYSKSNIFSTKYKSAVLSEYFTDEKAYYKVIGREWHNELDDEGERYNYYTDIYGLFFPKQRLIYTSRNVNKNYIKDNFDKSQPAITRRFSIKSINTHDFYHALKFKLPFSRTNKHLFYLFLKDQVYNKEKDIKKDIKKEEKDRIHSLSAEQRKQKTYEKLFGSEEKKN